MMRFDIATLFVEMCERVLDESIIGRARRAGKLEVHCHNIRDYTQDKHKRVDDTPYGGGKGMLMQAEPICHLPFPKRFCFKPGKGEEAERILQPVFALRPLRRSGPAGSG